LVLYFRAILDMNATDWRLDTPIRLAIVGDPRDQQGVLLS